MRRGRAEGDCAVEEDLHRTGLDRDSKAQAEQVRSIAVERVGGLLGMVPLRLMVDIDEALRLHLGL